MKEEIEQRDVQEVTQISFEKNSGATITTISKEQEEKVVEEKFELAIEDKI